MLSQILSASVLPQLERMSSCALVFVNFEKPLTWNLRQSSVHLEYFNEVGSVTSLLECPESQMFQSFLVWHILNFRDHSSKAMLNFLQLSFVLSIMRRPCHCTVFNQGTDQRLI